MIVFAANVHVGGGKVLLDSLLVDQPFGPVTAAFIDSRYQPPKTSNHIEIFSYHPTILDRLRSQYDLRRFCKAKESGTDVLFFGNYPPFFKVHGRRLVYLQNCFLLSGVPLPKDSVFVMLRNAIERSILKIFQRNIDEIWVQSEWMAYLCRKNFPAVQVFKKPFLPILPKPDPRIAKVYDFICVASESKHKNIKALVKVLETLDLRAEDSDAKPISILFVLPDPASPKLKNFLDSSLKNLRVDLIVSPNRENLFRLYQQSRNIILTSEFESFCLPLYEAHHFEIGIVAHDRPFFREVGFVDGFLNLHDPMGASEALIRSARGG